MNLTTEQEKFWAGDFGTEYVDRNVGEAWVASSAALFAKIISRTQGIKSYLECGANIGLNIRALQTMLPNSKGAAIEINPKAVETLKRINNLEVFHESMLSFSTDKKWDLVFTKGVLIHIEPSKLQDVYALLVNSSNRYIAVVEYYNPAPVELSYRGHTGKLYKRDFAGEIIDLYPTVKLIDYGFVYHRDVNYPQDDMTWFLMEK